MRRGAGQRGAPAPLPHCGLVQAAQVAPVSHPTRGAGAPPSLRHAVLRLSEPSRCTTRGAGAPPSLRQPVRSGIRTRPRPNEGRRRPSLIAARRPTPCYSAGACQRGAPAPLPHCGLSSVSWKVEPPPQRGAPAPLPHCGPPKRPPPAASGLQRGAPAPLPHCGRSRTRPATWPPLQRGAPAPLPHCGRFPHPGTRKCIPNEGRRRPSLIAAVRNAQASQSSWANEGRRRPSLIAAHISGPDRPQRWFNEGRRRPSLIAASSAFIVGVSSDRQRGAPAPLPHCGRTLKPKHQKK